MDSSLLTTLADFKSLRGHLVSPHRPEEWDAGDYVTYGRWDNNPAGPWFVSDFASGSDYSGSLVEKSNFETLRDMAQDGEPVSPAFHVLIHGGHGTYGIAFHVERTPRDILEILAALENYPLADEEKHSELEMEEQDTAWENWAKTDYRRALEKLYDGDADDVTDDDLFSHFRDAADKANVYWENQSGSDMHIDIDRVISHGATHLDPPAGYKSPADVLTFEVIDHGCDGSQYFPGCGVSHTPYTKVATGIGDTSREALDDALDSMAQDDARPSAAQEAEMVAALADPDHSAHSELDIHTCAIDGVRPDTCDCVEKHNCDGCDWQHYVSVRYTERGES